MSWFHDPKRLSPLQKSRNRQAALKPYSRAKRCHHNRVTTRCPLCALAVPTVPREELTIDLLTVEQP